jgi:hypothetical protein
MPGRSPQNFGCDLDASVDRQITQNYPDAEDEGYGSKRYSDLMKQVGDQRTIAIYDDIEKCHYLLHGELRHGQ